MKFNTKKIWEIKEYKNIYDIFKRCLNWQFFIKSIVVLCAFWIIIYFWWHAYNYSKKVAKNVSIWAVKIISNQIWEDMKKDELGQINIMIVWYWGANHAWGYLADTTMIASFNPKLWAITFLSIPRDLYVKYDDWWYGRFNAVFAFEHKRTKSLDSSAKALAKKLTQITSIPIDYYALVDFKWFIKLVDTIGWVDINVPKDFADYEYPDWNRWYQVFKISKGQHHIDWETALKYARSRHSTSDFSRSLRQQQIIKALITKILSPENITNIWNLKKIYADYNQMVYTNISLKNMLSMVKYTDNLKHFFSYVYVADCNFTHYSVMWNWCMLSYADRAQFWWASVLLPVWATPSKIEHYDEMKNFAFYVVYNQKYLIENPSIKIINWIDKTIIKKTKNYNKKDVSKLAIKLKNYVFNIQELNNSKQIFPTTTLYKNWTWDYSETINLLKTFVDIDQILTWNNTMFTWDKEIDTDLTLVIWNDYLNN